MCSQHFTALNPCHRHVWCFFHKNQGNETLDFLDCSGDSFHPAWQRFKADGSPGETGEGDGSCDPVMAGKP